MFVPSRASILKTTDSIASSTFTLTNASTAELASLNAQQPSASVVGRVTDATGAVIPGVAIKITNLDTNIAQAGSTNQVGDFTTTSVPPMPRELPLAPEPCGSSMSWK